MFGIKISDVQSHVDKKVSLALQFVQRTYVRNGQHVELQHKVVFLEKRLAKLTEYLGVEYTEECVKGFTKAKKK